MAATPVISNGEVDRIIDDYMSGASSEESGSANPDLEPKAPPATRSKTAKSKNKETAGLEMAQMIDDFLNPANYVSSGEGNAPTETPVVQPEAPPPTKSKTTAKTKDKVAAPTAAVGVRKAVKRRNSGKPKDDQPSAVVPPSSLPAPLSKTARAQPSAVIPPSSPPAPQPTTVIPPVPLVETRQPKRAGPSKKRKRVTVTLVNNDHCCTCGGEKVLIVIPVCNCVN